MAAKNIIFAPANTQFWVQKNVKGIDVIRVEEDGPNDFKVVFLKKKHAGLLNVLTIGSVAPNSLLRVIQSGTGINVTVL